MNEYLKNENSLAPYMVFPRFLLDAGINETAMILYTFLLDRARLSLKSDKWTDESGHTFLYYPVKSLAETLHKSEMTIKTSLATLEKADLIKRVKQGAGMPSRIYVKIPAERDRKLSVGGTEYYHTEGQETVCRRDRKLSTIKNNGYKTKYQEKEYRDYSCRENESL